MISNSMEGLINDQIKIELYSAYLYLSMVNYFKRINLEGFAHWLQLQHDEERGHAQKLIDYLIDRGGSVQLSALSKPPVNFGTPLQTFEEVLAHEQEVTQSYKNALEKASIKGDYQTVGIMRQFLQEQIDEEAQPVKIIGKLQLVQNNPGALLILNQEMAQRTG